MEQRLFLVACIMYAFSLGTRFLKKKASYPHPKLLGDGMLLSCLLY